MTKTETVRSKIRAALYFGFPEHKILDDMQTMYGWDRNEIRAMIEEERKAQ